MTGEELSRGRLPPALNMQTPETTLTPLRGEHFPAANVLHFAVEPEDYSMSPVEISSLPPVRARLV